MGERKQERRQKKKREREKPLTMNVHSLKIFRSAERKYMLNHVRQMNLNLKDLDTIMEGG